jgi:hypothetical protein
MRCINVKTICPLLEAYAERGRDLMIQEFGSWMTGIR